MMNLLKKIAIAILVVFLVAGASIFVLSRFVPERDFIKSAIETKLNAATNRQVSIGSVKIEFGFPSLLNVVVKNISITDHSKRELFSAAGLRLKVGLWSLMTGGLSLDDLKISSARLVIYRDASGNTESVFSKKTAGVEEQAPPSESEPGSGVTRKSPPTGAPQANKLSKAAGRNEFSWPIKQIEIESSQVVFEVSSVGLAKPVRLAFEKISGHITRDQNSLDFTVVGTPNFPGLESSELKTKGFVKVGPGFSFIESANINTTLDTARLVNPWFLPQETSAWFDKLRVNNLTLHTLMQRGSPPQIDFSARMFQTDGSAGLRFRVSGTLAPDFSHIEGLRINGSSDDVPISGVSGFVAKQVLHQFAPDGSVNLSFEGSWTQAGWSVIGSAGFNNFSTPAKYAFVGKKLAAALSFEVTPNSFLIKDLELQNGARSKLLFMKGSINNPFSNTRSLDFNARLNLEGSWLKKLGINVPKDFNLGGPVPTHAHLTGPLKELKLDLNGDLSGSSLALKSVFEKEIGVKAEFKASTVISMDLTKSLNELFKHIDIKFSVGNTTINLVSGFASISGCPIKLDAEILSSGEWLDLKNLSLKIDLPGNKRSLIFTKGYIKRFNSLVPDLNIQGNLTLSRELIELLGLAS
ncbi:MAG: AsmA family protein, partial [Desulfomonilaceae bacterium]